MNFASGAYLKCTFGNDHPHGKGTYNCEKDKTSPIKEYNGKFDSGLRQGQGKMTWKDGSKYDGMW